MTTARRIPSQLLEMGYHDTYYYAQVVNRTMTDSMLFLRTLDEFFGDLQYVKFLEPFPKWSALHKYVWFAVEAIEYEQISEALDAMLEAYSRSSILQKDPKLGIERTLEAYGFEHVSFRSWADSTGVDFANATEDDILEYYHFLDEEPAPDSGVQKSLPGPRARLYEQICEEVFFLTFMNRSLLLNLNQHIAENIHEITMGEVPEDEARLFARDGALRRQSIPSWVRRAVFHRDRGRCTICGTDLSGTLSLRNAENYDHVVPLAKGGINDVTNIQLLCKDCNARKRDGDPVTSNHVERWYT